MAGYRFCVFLHTISITFCIFSMMLHHKYNKRLFIWFIMLSLSVILMATFILQGGFTGHRSVAYFNNKTNLDIIAYYAMFFKPKNCCKKNHTHIGLVLHGNLVMASLSKAAIIPYFVMLLYYI